MENCKDKRWVCVRTKPKHEVAAATYLRSSLDVEVFFPRIQYTRSTRRGTSRIVDSLFPGYIFVHCILDSQLELIRFSPGVSSLVHFSHEIPVVPDPVIAELKEYFKGDSPLLVEESLSRGMEITIIDGPLLGSNGTLLRLSSSSQRVQVLLDFLGRSTVTYVERYQLAVNGPHWVKMVPGLARS